MTGAAGACGGGGFPYVLRFTDSVGGPAITSKSTSDPTTSPRTCTVHYTSSAGAGGHRIFIVDMIDGTADNQLFLWLQDGAAGNYECRATQLTGTVTTGTMSTWLALTSDRTWTKTVSGVCTFTLDIGLLGASTALISITVTL